MEGIEASLDRLERIVAEGRRIPLLAGKVLVPEDDIYALIDEIRASLPEEIKQARWVTKERERLLDEARQEAEGIIENARADAARLAEESTVIEQARQVAREITAGAREYADEVLETVERNLERILQAIRQGRNELSNKKA